MHILRGNKLMGAHRWPSQYQLVAHFVEATFLIRDLGVEWKKWDD
jgi:hypothetical protein